MDKISYLLAALIILLSSPLSQAGAPLKSGSNDQTGVEVTVYNNNLGLVKDQRKLALPKGTGEVRFMDVAAHVMPATVLVKSISDPGAFSVLEQNYEYDLISPSKLLDKYVGKKVKLLDINRFQDRKEIIDATLLSNNQGPIYKIKDEIYIGYPGIRILPKLPENLIAKPTLMWLYDNQSDKPHQLEVSYLTRNVGWKADYVLLLNKDDTLGDLTGWVTVDNKSGATYNNARLKLVAGETNLVQDQGIMAKAPRAFVAAERSKAEAFQEKAFFEYHIYDLQRKTTIKDKQTKQISLLEATGAKVKKELLVYGMKTFFTREYHPSKPKQPVDVYIKFKNSKENNLGMPLPAGVMRLYKSDQDNSQQFIGEDRIEHTPKDEEVKLKIGEAFDVVAERRQIDFKRITTRMYETEWEIKLRNHKDKEVQVGVIEPLLGNWEVMGKTHPFRKLDAFTIRFDVKVPKDSQVVVKYRIRVGI